MIKVNVEDHDASFDSVQALMTQLGIDPRGVAVAVNGEIVRRGAWGATHLGDGDVIEVVSAAAGG